LSLCVPVEMQSKLYQAVIFSDNVLVRRFIYNILMLTVPQWRSRGEAPVGSIGDEVPQKKNFY